MGVLTLKELLSDEPNDRIAVAQTLRMTSGRIATLHLAPVVKVSLKIQHMLKKGPLRVSFVRRECLAKYRECAYDMAVKTMKLDGLLREGTSRQSGEQYLIRINAGVSSEQPR